MTNNRWYKYWDPSVKARELRDLSREAKERATLKDGTIHDAEYARQSDLLLREWHRRDTERWERYWRKFYPGTEH